MDKKWHIEPYDEKAAAALAGAVGVSPLVGGILWKRGFRDPVTAKRFLDAETEQEFYDPLLLPGMEKAVARLRTALENRERITVYGDYDVDGVTATALLLRVLRRLGATADYFIPTRAMGYGVHQEALERLADEGTSLVITVDCGINAVTEAAAMRDRLDLIITDHHLPGESLPEAVAVIDPHRADSAYPYRDLAGVGVAFKLCQALWQAVKGETFSDYLELVALGTVADLVPLLDENRKLVKLGLPRFDTTPILGIKALIASSGLAGRPVTAGNIGFVLGPRLNAAGRLETAARGAELLLTEDANEASKLAALLERANLERRQVEQDILAQAEDKLSRIDISAARVLVVAGADWHPGVIGLVASRLTERYYRPAVVISIRDGVGRGSCRSIPAFPLFDALAASQETLLQFGGHAMAAGLSVEPAKIPALRDRLEAFADEHLTAEDYIPAIELEAELPPSTVTTALIDEIARLEPYGMGNPQPLFGIRDITAENAKVMGRGEVKKHLMFQAQGVRAVGFNRADDLPLLTAGPVDMIYTPSIDDWNGQRYVECMIKELSEAASRKVFPTREILADAYRRLRGLADASGRVDGSEENLAVRLGLSFYTMRQTLTVFRELGLVQREKGGWRFPPPPRQKLDLADSETFARYMGKK
ncbi:MAG: single-stranded-DNA-specific exonuclease RecJ [Schwartzia sp.]|nr:single-stranded-DNA-specific exonuclease RecJ [Schwartzia sp. (in: firmicutes)]